MDEDTFKANLNTLRELILDEHKLVTYISLSKDLCIHVNEAKSLLSQVILDIRKSQPGTDIQVSYLISGLLNVNSATTTVCPETELDTLKKSLKVIFYEHVYCVSRGMKSVDNVALSVINKFEDLSLCIGLIKDGLCTKRTEDEIGNLKSIPTTTKDSKTHVAPQTIIKPKIKENISNGHVEVKKKPQVKTETTIKTEIQQSPKKDVSPKKGPSPKKSTITKKNGVKTPATKSIAGFFSKANGDAKITKAVKTVKDEPEKPKVENIKLKAEPIATEEKPLNATENKTTSKSSKEKNYKSDTSISKIKKNAKVDKKRKRLLHVSDSESETETNDPFADEMAVDQESEDEIPPTPTVNTVKITSGIINPKKRRKIVDKTYTDENGYFLTKKEEVYESCSDEDNLKDNEQAKENIKVNEPPKQIQIKTEISPKENGKGKKKKLSPPQKGTQKTMMSFFKKV